MADRFTKMHGLGNDFVVIDARMAPVEMTPARAHAIAARADHKVVELHRDRWEDAAKKKRERRED